jgi:hypothetical protein
LQVHQIPDLVARCVELVPELRGPEAHRAAGVLDALVRSRLRASRPALLKRSANVSTLVTRVVDVVLSLRFGTATASMMRCRNGCFRRSRPSKRPMRITDVEPIG